MARTVDSNLALAIRDILFNRSPGTAVADATAATVYRDPRLKARAERFSFRVPMLVRISGSREELRGWLRNISASGIGFALTGDLSLGTRVEVGFEDVELDALLGVPFLQCLITRCAPAGDGVFVLGARFALAGKFVDRQEIPQVPEEDLKKVREAMFE